MTHTGAVIMDEQANTLAMTVHLLASSGDAVLLQQILDHLFLGLWPDIQLFHVSERGTSIKYFESYPRKIPGFPGMSVLLFLHEDFGEERILHTLNFFQHPPWQLHRTEYANGRLSACMPVSQDFYSLDVHMPVWGVRQVHYGTEILRITLYCSFDNFEDAVRLYEMLLQKEATVQKSSFIFFVLYSKEKMCVQLSIKQLPPGVPVEVKESSVLQFKVQEIGQLVPLLPNPCMRISHTRWQTQDYDGHKILLQVQDSTRGKDTFVPDRQESKIDRSALLRHVFRNKENTDRKDRYDSVRSDTQNWTFQPGTYNNSLEASDRSESLHSESPCGTPRSGSYCSSQGSSPAVPTQCTTQSKARVPSQEMNTETQEEETNVDTGFTVVLSECSPSPLTCFSSDLYNNLPYHAAAQDCTSTEVGSQNQLRCEKRPRNSSMGVNKYKGVGKGSSKLTQSSIKNHGNKEEEDEEFFI
ncbi:hypothetical protein NDU88_001866 [Pleurodeles waltl]|uniref:FAM124 domain-containing protein n=1 Tax=Pleurodeles waltl TaxID=8319 RepID=A0AAV7LB02_PLEWA|nr:hypothetical protein NDU88_001866 [Pleurodeles waltl]